MKRSPWFNARRDPPVNGGPNAVYEHRCADLYAHFFDWRLTTRMTARNIKRLCCARCQWRGLLRESKK